jgi:DegV family protein with EDD domain
VLAAAGDEDADLDSALSAVASARRRLQLFAALDSMEYVRRSGRVQGTLALLGSLLNVKPLIELKDGEVKANGVVRTARQANDRMDAFLRSAGQLERLAILHTGAEARARAFLTRIMSEVSQSLPRDILMINATTVIGTHIGPGALGFAAVIK